MGEAIGKSMDISTYKFDIRVLSGSTMPINRWAYLEELKSLMQMGVVDDVAVLAETDLKNKDKIVQRKSLYAQLQGQVSSLSQAIKDKDGTIETLERQLVQAGIKHKVMQADVEINKKKEQVKSQMGKELTQTQSQQQIMQQAMANNQQMQQERLRNMIGQEKKDLQNMNNSE